MVEPLSMMSVVSTAHDVTSMDDDITGATRLNGIGQMYGEGWICIWLKWLERSVPGTEEG